VTSPLQRKSQNCRLQAVPASDRIGVTVLSEEKYTLENSSEIPKSIGYGINLECIFIFQYFAICLQKHRFCRAKAKTDDARRKITRYRLCHRKYRSFSIWYSLRRTSQLSGGILWLAGSAYSKPHFEWSEPLHRPWRTAQAVAAS
jgi:hypothetical protein